MVDKIDIIVWLVLTSIFIIVFSFMIIYNVPERSIETATIIQLNNQYKSDGITYSNFTIGYKSLKSYMVVSCDYYNINDTVKISYHRYLYGYETIWSVVNIPRGC